MLVTMQYSLQNQKVTTLLHSALILNINNLYPCELYTEYSAQLSFHAWAFSSRFCFWLHHFLTCSWTAFPHCSRAQYWPKFWPMFCSFPGTWTGTEIPGEIKPTTHRATNAALISSLTAQLPLCTLLTWLSYMSLLPKQLQVYIIAFTLILQIGSY